MMKRYLWYAFVFVLVFAITGCTIAVPFSEIEIGNSLSSAPVTSGRVDGPNFVLSINPETPLQSGEMYYILLVPVKFEEDYGQAVDGGSWLTTESEFVYAVQEPFDVVAWEVQKVAIQDFTSQGNVRILSTSEVAEGDTVFEWVEEAQNAR